MAKNKFERDLAKILNKGVIFENRSGRSSVYKIDVNLNGKFAVRKWPYWSGAVHGRKPVEEWEYEKADDAVAKFEEIKKFPGCTWDPYDRLSYAN
jgi:hypothetical protein